MATTRLHRVAVLVLEGAKPLDVGIPAQMFSVSVLVREAEEVILRERELHMSNQAWDSF